MKIIEVAKRLRTLWRMSGTYDSDIVSIRRAIDATADRIAEHTVVHADIHMKEPHQVVVIGRYRNRDYVRIFSVSAGRFDQLIGVLQDEEKHARIGRFDTPGNWPTLSVVYPRDRL